MGPYTTTAQKDYAPHDRVAVNGGVCGRHVCHGRGLLISHDPDAARSALRSFGFSITVPITRGGGTIPYSTISIRGTVDYCGAEETRSGASGRAGGDAVER